MDESRWERFGAASGIAFVALVLASSFVTPTPPHSDASATRIAEYYADNSGAVLAATVCGVLAIFAFVWFVSHLRHVLNRAEGGAEAFAPVVYGSGLVTAAVAAACGLPPATLAYLARLGELEDGGAIRTMFAMNLVGGALLSIVLTLFLAATSAAMLRGELVSRSLGWCGAGAAALSFVPGVAMLYSSTHNAFWYGAGMVGFLAFAAWMLAVSIHMLRRPEIARAPAAGGAFAH